MNNPLSRSERAIIQRATRNLREASELIPTQSSSLQTAKAGGVSSSGEMFTCGILGVTLLSEFWVCNDA